MPDQKPSSDYLGYSKKVVSSVLGDLTKKHATTKTPAEILIDRAKQVTINVHNQIKPILQAGGGFDKESLADMVGKLYLEEFNKFTKEELVNIVTIMHGEIVLGQIISADPTGSGKPDLMSGV